MEDRTRHLRRVSLGSAADFLEARLLIDDDDIVEDTQDPLLAESTTEHSTTEHSSEDPNSSLPQQILKMKI